MRIRIIDPSYYQRDGQPARYPKLWVTGLTGVHLAALSAPHDVDLSFDVFGEPDYDEPLDLVAITAMGPQLIRALDIADEYRRRGAQVVIGGYQASLVPDFVAPHVDALVVGEAEPVWPKLLADASRRALAPRYDGRSGAPLQGLPPPRYDLLRPGRHSRLMPVEATRGCPKLCSYCAIADRYKGGARTRPVAEVLRDVRAVIERGSRDIFFVDSNLIGDLAYARELLRALRPLDIRWTSQVTTEIGAEPELLDLARDSGCELLSIGFESINQHSLRGVGKGFNRVDQYRRTIDAIMQRGIHVNALIMYGLDDDHEDVFIKTADFFASAGISLLDCFILVPMPGTRLYDRMKQEGRLLTEDFRHYDVTNVVFRPRHMTPETLSQGLWRSFQHFYSRRSIAKRMARNYRSSAYAWAALLGLNVMYRRLVFNHDSRHPNVWHAPYV
jgi:radical SAM superfamily enzyme YgiQ (UPF0313 family)